MRARRGLMLLWLNVLVLSTFGLSYLVLLPVFAAEVLQVGKTGLGQLYTVAGIGSLAGLLLTARLSGEVPRGWLVIGVANGFAWSVIGFALTTHPLLAKGLLMLAGMFGVMQLVSTNTALQTAAPAQTPRPRVATAGYPSAHALPGWAESAGSAARAESPRN